MTQDEIKQLQAQAADGDPESQYRLAMMHIYGDGVAEDNVAGWRLLEQAAAQGHVEATYNLGICYHYGYGTRADPERAFRLYQTCAEAGYGKGLELVGRFYNRGLCVPRDRERAEYWLKRAMKSDDSQAVAEAKRELDR